MAIIRSRDTPVCTPEYLHSAVWSGPTPAALVAHSCAFERQFVTEATTGAIPWICTYKVAMHVWPDAAKMPAGPEICSADAFPEKTFPT